MSSVYDISSMYDSYKQSVQSATGSKARKMVKSEEDDGEYMQYFGDTLNQSYAEAITESGQVGLAKQLYDSMKRN